MVRSHDTRSRRPVRWLAPLLILLVLVLPVVLGVLAAVHGGDTDGGAVPAASSSSPRARTMSPAPSRTVTPVAPARVRAHASDVSKRFNAEASTIIRAANLSPYEIVARQGHADADALDRADETLTSDIQVGLHWPDGRPSSESARMIRTLDADLAAWRTALWSTLNGYAVRDMNAAAGQYALARGDGRQACPAVEGLLKSRPSDPAGRAGFESASTWLNRLDDAWQACDAAAAR